MESQEGNGPDGTSLKPVSSLRARFENMSKPSDSSPPSAPSTTPAAPAPPPRNPSPTPKPPPIPETRPVRSTPPVTHDDGRPPPIPETRPVRSTPPVTQDDGRPPINKPAALQIPQTTGTPAHARLSNPPTLSPKPVKPPPSVLIDPPHSPPKGRIPNPVGGDGSQLTIDPTKTPGTPTTPYKLSSRPHTPILEPRRSPRLSASQPPSPPPPRRSVELRKDRDAKAAAPPVPPPINRAEKPGANRLSQHFENGYRPSPIGQIATEKSPFNSPPSSPERDQPPELPNRPPARPLAPKPGPLMRTNTFPVQFEPPPVHPSVMSRRQEANGTGKNPAALATSAEPSPPALPTRPHTVVDPQQPRIPATSTKPPPRPPRPGVQIPATNAPPENGKRVVSNPPTQPQPATQPQPVTHFAPPPPTRTHGRSMTVDRTSDRTPSEFRDTPRRMNTVAERKGRVPESQVSGPTALSAQITTAYPDSSNINRRPPYTKKGVHEVHTKYDTRIVDVCGQYVCTSGHLTRVWNLMDGELLMSFAHGEGVKATAVSFKCGLSVDDEGSRLWIGNNVGEIMEADVATSSIIGNKSTAHGRYEITKIYRFYNQMWTLDESGALHVWGPDSDGSPNLHNPPHQSYRLPRGHSFSLIVGTELWHATGKEIRVFAPTLDNSVQVQVLVRPMVAEGAGDVTSGTLIKSQPGKVYLGHSDGKVSIWSQQEFTCLGVLTISTWKINALAGVAGQLWAGFNTGRVCTYDIEQSPWIVKKEWQAHPNNPVIKLAADDASFYKVDRLQVISLGADNMVRCWDGLLQDDYLEGQMKLLDSQYCEFEDIKAMVMTWNAGASTPTSLRYSEQDATFVQNLIESSGSPDILVFGFQELVDLEDKKATAKRLFKSKKKDAVTDQERMSHQYRDWRDYLIRSLDDYMPPNCLYHLLHTSTLVGLFTCIFVKSTIRDRISNLSSADVKRGMGGLHGNKGAIIVRFMVDDTSMCFINCHLAAGQSQANARHTDIASIMDSTMLPAERDSNIRIDSFVGGGDGTMILDHELCLINGDLNYRIDTMSRDTVVAAVKANNLTKLLDRDQLLVARRRNPGFRLRAFEEMPINFAPTYKYDVGTDNYDTSEKKRSPAWCDRLLHRGCGKIEQLEYRRHEVRVSDHRPVTGQFKFTIKRVSPKRRAMTWADCQQRFEDMREREARAEKLHYLSNVLGYDAATANSLIQDNPKRPLSRSPSRRVD